jgi:hypothetical protein
MHGGKGAKHANNHKSASNTGVTGRGGSIVEVFVIKGRTKSLTLSQAYPPARGEDKFIETHNNISYQFTRKIGGNMRI